MSDSKQERHFRVALIGNPNSGKSTVFNQLTGLRQKTGNFPGVTVDIKEGPVRFPNGLVATVVDLPGTYSLYPTSADEKIVARVLSNLEDPAFPDALIYVADITNLEKHLLLLTQLLDLNLPIVVALNMCDTADALGIKYNVAKLSDKLGLPVIAVSGRTGENIQRMIGEIEKLLCNPVKPAPKAPFYTFSDAEKQLAEAVRLNLGIENPYRALLVLHHREWLPHLHASDRETLATIAETKKFQSLRAQVDETLDRFDRFTPIVRDTIQQPPTFPSTPTDRLDAVLTHRIGGPFIFFGVMLLVFMTIFYGYAITGDWVEQGMDWITQSIGALVSRLNNAWLTDLVTKGILEGFKGIFVFVPQIALLFLLITILEEVGYLARVVFMFDKSMRRFGMNGRSIVALIGGGACAVPAIMGTRTISNWKERIITIMVTPFISCSARIPVYMVLIPIALPTSGWWTWALVFGGMYLFGIVAALGSAYVFKKVLRTREVSYLALEMPVYRMPHWRNVWLTVWDKIVSFISGVWKTILVITIVLWVMGHTGPGNVLDVKKQQIENQYGTTIPADSLADIVAGEQLGVSYLGIVGKSIEPAIRPLGYDWKIGIALLTSIAAREVFNGTMYTIYSLESVGEKEDQVAADQKPFERYVSLRNHMRDDVYTRGNKKGEKVYSMATGLSLLVFYALAMQCMSTLAAVKRETGRWKWAILQFVYMSGMAYLGAWMTFLLFS